MAHKLKIDERIRLNKDGSPNKRGLKDYFLRHVGRGGRWVKGPFTREQVIFEQELARYRLITAHQDANPNDSAFKVKHGLA